MPKVKLAPWIEEAYGSYGKHTTFRRTPKGENSIIKKADMSNVEWSPAQIAQRQRMKDAIAYAQAILADPEKKKLIATPTQQIVMPIEGFARAFATQQRIIKKLVDSGILEKPGKPE